MIIKRFLVISLVGIILSFSLLAYLVTNRETALLERAAEEKASFYASSVITSLNKSMVQGVPEIAKSIVYDLNRKGTLKVSIYRPDGSLAFGDGGIDIPAYVFSGQKEVIIKQGNEFISLHPLLNEPSCHKCHPEKNMLLGIATIKMPLKSITSNIEATGRHLLIFGIFLVCSAAIAVFIVAKKTLLDPIMLIHTGVALIKKGDLSHRISFNRVDELGTLAAAFNDMTASLEKSHTDLEKAVRQKTIELRVIAELSTEVFKGDLSLNTLIEQFLNAITERMGFKYAAVCLVEKNTGMLSREFKKGIDHGFCDVEISLASDHPLTKTIREAMPVVKKNYDIGTPESFANIVIIPILSHQRKRCREVNLCTHEKCHAYSSPDDRCWLIENTFCRSPHSVAGKEKIYGCLHCAAFPVLGVLVAGRGTEISKSSLHSIEILASSIASAIENQRLIEAKKEDINKLIKLHDISVASLQSIGYSLTKSIISPATVFSNMDGAVLWLTGGDGRLYYEDSSHIEKELIPGSIPIDGSFMGKGLLEDRPIETLEMESVSCLGDIIRHHGFMYAASVPLKLKDTAFGCLTLFKKKDFLMTDSEKAIILLFASQAAAAINTSRIYDKMKEEEKFSDAIFNGAASGIMVLDKDGYVLKINEVGKDILQYDIETIVGKRIIELFPEAADMLVLNRGQNRDIELTLPDGTITPVGFNNSPLFDSARDREGTIVIFRDMSEIKRLQAELKKKEHFDTMGKVVSGVAHEIRNPLFGISSIGQILERELDSPQHLSLIRAMLKETDRMKRLIEELLMYTRPSRLDIKEIDLAALLEELNHYVKAKGGDFAIAMDIQPMITIKADRDKLTQVMLNLLNNAIDAAKSMIAVSARKSNNMIKIEIRDDGNGISQEDLTRIFDPFFTTKKGGTGLGLPICRKIVEDHGGTIKVKSDQGKGTVVYLNFNA